MTRPCARCGRPCATGGNTRDLIACRDCRAADPTWLDLITNNTKETAA